MTNLEIESLNNELSKLSLEELLIHCNQLFDSSIVCASSLGPEDQVLTHYIQHNAKDIPIFVLDTLRLHQATYDVMTKTMNQYDFEYTIVLPKAEKIKPMVKKYGKNLFYQSLELRELCCFNRKVEPLIRALSGKKAWITGLRRAQSITRATMPMVEWDSTHQLIKINPLLHWSKDDVWSIINTNNIPVNKLHDDGFPSIGCAPCTRAIQPGEDERAGRWWWESPEQKECGLHKSILKKGK